ncbi:flagellar assembly protein FliH, partial [Pseudomonas syringae]|nr:flagellar assembly protein FliH [Pseudomonas syringae]
MSTSNKELASDLIRAKDAGTLDIWALPSFDPHVEPEPEPEPEPVDEPAEMEEVPLDEVQPLTL